MSEHNLKKIRVLYKRINVNNFVKKCLKQWACQLSQTLPDLLWLTPPTPTPNKLQPINNAKSSGQPKHGGFFFSIRPPVVQGANHQGWGSACFNLQQRQRAAAMNTQDKEFVRSPTESLIMPQCHFRSSQTFASCWASTALSIFLAYVKLPGNLVLD